MASEPKRFKTDESEASRVILITDLLHTIDDREIVALYSRYGNVVDMLRISQGRSALLEFDDISIAKKMVSQSQVNTFYVGNTPVKMAYGNSPSLVRKKGAQVSSMSVLGFLPHPGGDQRRIPEQVQQQQPPMQQQMQQQPPMQQQMQQQPPMQQQMQQQPPMQQQMQQQPPMQQQMQQPPPSIQQAPVTSLNGTSAASNALAMQGLPGRVLLFSVASAVYPITVDVMKTICAPCGNVLRISVGPKKADSSLEALVEFENVADANKAIDSLNGADIYSGCCTLTITVSHLPVLQVFKNDAESYDFTNPNLGNEKAALLGDSPASAAPLIASAVPTHQPPPAVNQMPPSFMPQQQEMLSKPQMFIKGEGTVIMAYNLPSGLTCQNLFNVACLYGNVARVKFLKSREGCAMIQMGAPDQSDNVIQHLSGLSVSGQKIEVCRSKQPEVQVHPKPDLMPNGTPLSVCYEDSINNRFKRPDAFSKSRIVSPAKTLHFFNFPPSTSESAVYNFLKANDAPLPDKIVVFKLKQADQKYAMGLVEFNSIEQAVLAVMRCNHVEVKQVEGSRSRFHAKLSFSTKPIDVDDKNAVTFKPDAEGNGGESDS